MTKTVVTKTGAMPHSDGDDGNDIGGSDKVEGAISRAAMLHCDGGGQGRESTDGDGERVVAAANVAETAQRRRCEW